MIRPGLEIEIRIEIYGYEFQPENTSLEILNMKKSKHVFPGNTKNNERKVMGRFLQDVAIPIPELSSVMPDGYSEFIAEIKERIARERIKSVLSANSAMVLMYWDIGTRILEKQHNEVWGSKVIDRLSHDLKTAFPEMSGFSPRNLKYMRKFAESWPDRSIVQEVLAQITWYHNLALLEKANESKIRLWYARKTLEYGWSRNILALQLETRLYEREGKSINNFPIALPPADSDMAATRDEIMRISQIVTCSQPQSNFKRGHE